MAKYGGEARVYLDNGNGSFVDLSEYVKSVNIEAPPLEAALTEGLKRIFARQPITMTFDFDMRLTCPLCGMSFAPPEIVPVPHVSINDGPLLPCCDACAIEHLT